MNGHNEIASTLRAIIETAQQSLPAIDHVGISVVHRGGRVETVAASDHLVWDLDALQYQLGEGPCLAAVHTDPVVLIEHASWERRWPRFIRQAVALGVRANLSIRLGDDEETLGALNLYTTITETFDPETLTLAELLATHAALALSRANHEEQLNQALMTRKVIGQAVGLLMGRYELDEDRAFAYLTRLSQDTNTKLRDVAMELVARANEVNRLPEKRFAQEPQDASEWADGAPHAPNGSSGLLGTAMRTRDFRDEWRS